MTQLPGMGTAPLLELRDFSVAFGERAVLRGLTLSLSGSCLSLVGHAGAGKSTLLRTLAGLNDAQPELRIGGEARYLGKEIGAGPRPWLVGQKATLLLATVFENVAQALSGAEALGRAEKEAIVEVMLREALGDAVPPMDARVIGLPLAVQRCLAILRGVAAGADLLMVDEPTAGLPDEGRELVLGVLRRQREKRAILQVTHHLGDIRELGGDVVLLVGGRVAERSTVEELFSAPKTAAGRRFVQTGTCYFEGEEPSFEEPAAGLTTDSALEQEQEQDGRPPPETANRAAPAPSRYLHWVIPGKLLGMPRPGVVREVDDDLGLLRQMGIREVICLEESATVPAEALSRHGMRGTHVPIEDMRAPTVGAACEVCAVIRDHVEAGNPVAVHCLGGAGRTGLILAAYFIFMGSSALDALESVRRVQPRFVQSQEQVDFLSSFEVACRAAGLRQK
ncbi:MAG: ATP-binding cassette domain-containing protein [Polyangiaceae bacterium]